MLQQTCTKCKKRKQTDKFYIHLQTGNPQLKCKACDSISGDSSAMPVPKPPKQLCLLRICGFYAQGKKEYCKKHQKQVDRQGEAFFAGLPKRTRHTPQPFCDKECVLVPWEADFLKYQRSAAIKHHDFSLTLQQFTKLILADCFYCGLPAEAVSRRRNGIDRVDNEHGYVMDNVVTACWPCNKRKGAFSFEDFKSLIEQQSEMLQKLKEMHQRWQQLMKTSQT